MEVRSLLVIDSWVIFDALGSHAFALALADVVERCRVCVFVCGIRRLLRESNRAAIAITARIASRDQSW